MICVVMFYCFSTIRSVFGNPFEHLRWSFFAKIVNSWKLSTIFAKNSIVDLRVGSKYTSEDVKVFDVKCYESDVMSNMMSIILWCCCCFFVFVLVVAQVPVLLVWHNFWTSIVTVFPILFFFSPEFSLANSK